MGRRATWLGFAVAVSVAILALLITRQKSFARPEIEVADLQGRWVSARREEKVRLARSLIEHLAEAERPEASAPFIEEAWSEGLLTSDDVARYASDIVRTIANRDDGRVGILLDVPPFDPCVTCPPKTRLQIEIDQIALEINGQSQTMERLDGQSGGRLEAQWPLFVGGSNLPRGELIIRITISGRVRDGVTGEAVASLDNRTLLGTMRQKRSNTGWLGTRQAD